MQYTYSSGDKYLNAKTLKVPGRDNNSAQQGDIAGEELEGYNGGG